MSHTVEEKIRLKNSFDLFKVMKWNEKENDGLKLKSQADVSHFFRAYL